MATCYQPGGPFVDLYDQHFSDLEDSEFENDVEFYRSLAHQTGGPVLDLGSGTGRVAIPIGLDNIEIQGIELSPFMLREATRKAEDSNAKVRFSHGNMTNFKLDRKFKLVIVAFGAFHHLETVTDQLNCLSCIRSHLSVDGFLAIHLRNPKITSLKSFSKEEMPKRELIGIDSNTGNKIKSESIAQDINPLMQWLTEIWKHTEYDSKGNIVKTTTEEFKLRWIYYYEMEHLLVRSGFVPLYCFGNFYCEPIIDETQQIWLAQPAKLL